MTTDPPSRVQPQPDGTTLYTHGHRFPDNVQAVEQRHDASGRLLSAKVQWSGFAGQLLDVTATFDEQGRVVKEEGFRAPDMHTPLVELLRPLPAEPSPAPTQAADEAPISPPFEPRPAPGSLGERLRQIYPAVARPGGQDSPDK